jgi:hypothetical protein
MKNRIRRIYIKTVHWEYWPMWLVYLPVSFYFFYLGCKAKSFFFFSAANPSIETGGMFFESKWKIFELIPTKYFPKTLFIDYNEKPEDILSKMQHAKIDFPIIAKPDRGERGWCVKKLNQPNELNDYINSFKIPFLIQSYVDYPMELSVFYYRNPNAEKGKVTSVTLKKLLSVVGDGKATIGQLIMQKDRAFLKYEALKSNTKINFTKVLQNGEEEILVPYGNHVLGAMFVDYNHTIDNKLNHTFDEISKSIKGFYFGRFDLRCTNMADLKEGKNFSIMELNGSGAEPAHIYDPSFSFFKAQKVLAQHYKMMYEAASANKAKGIKYMTYKEFKETKKAEKLFKQIVQSA